MIRFSIIILALAMGSGSQGADLTDSRPRDVPTIFDCDFGKGWDNNYDRWPDHWTRVGGVRYPQFILAGVEKVSDNEGPRGKACSALTVHLNGGAFAAHSQAIEVSSHYSYQAEVDVQVSGVEKDRAQVTLQFLDEKKNLVHEIVSRPIGDTDGKWTRVNLGPIKPKSQKVVWVRVRLSTLPGEPDDLSGTIRFTGVWVGRLARLDLSTCLDPRKDRASRGLEFGIFKMGQELTVECTASGFKSDQPTVQFLLKDVDDKVVRSGEMRLRVSNADTPSQRLGTARWKVEPPGAGYYQIYAALENEESLRCRGETSIAVVEAFSWNSESEFGWSFPNGRGPYSIEQLAGLLLRLSNGWVEYPFWYGESTSEAEVEQLLRFIERLSTSGVKLVGLLCDPPPEVRKRFGNPPSLSAAEIFTADTELWYPSLETSILRLGPRVPYWLLGSHEDNSFLDQSHLQMCLAEIMKTIDRSEVGVMIGIPWRWIAAEPAWDNKAAGMPAFISLTADPPMTSRELSEYSQAFFSPIGKRKPQTPNSAPLRLPYRVILAPLDEEKYPSKVRAIDLVQRMLAAKQGGANAILMSDPFVKGSGMMHEDGTPDVLLLPWRTTTLNFGGSQYLGSIQLPKGSENRLFYRGTDVVMAVWSDLPCEECLYLGDDVKIIDIWGRSQEPRMEGDKQIIPVDSTPVFVTGLNPMVTKVRMSTHFTETTFPAILNREYDSTLVFKNAFPGGISGKVHLNMPEEWEVSPKRIPVQLVQKEKLEEPIHIKLPFSALAGKNIARIDFEVGNQKRYRFSVYRTLQVGADDMWMEFFPVFDQKGNLTIIQRFVNQTNDSISFRCQLAIPDRQWSEAQVVGMGRGAFEAKHFFPDAKDLIGQTVRVRATESNGLQTLNYNFLIE